MTRSTTEPTAGAVTVVVASRNRRDDLLGSLPRHEAPVVLVDNGSTDDTVQAVRQAHPEVTVLPLERNVGARARTIGAERAGTEFVAFADDDSWWAPGDLARAVKIMRDHPRLAVLNARILVGPEERLDPVCAEMADSPLGTPEDLPGPALLGFVACAALVRTSAFESVGGFDAVVRFPGEEERVTLDLAAAGWGLAYVDEVTVHHHPSPRREDPERRQAALWRSRCPKMVPSPARCDAAATAWVTPPAVNPQRGAIARTNTLRSSASAGRPCCR